MTDRLLEELRRAVLAMLLAFPQVAMHLIALLARAEQADRRRHHVTVLDFRRGKPSDFNSLTRFRKLVLKQRADRGQTHPVSNPRNLGGPLTGISGSMIITGCCVRWWSAP